MLKITKYGEQIQKDFLEHCKTTGAYQRVFEDFEDGTILLEDSIRGVKDCAAWHLITYGTDAINIVQGWQDYGDTICWCTNWKDLNNAFYITYTELLIELNKSLAERKADMNIRLTLAGEEIEQLEQVVGFEIKDKEELHSAVLMAIEKYVETYKESLI